MFNLFNVQTINCMQYNSEPGVLNSIIKLGRNHRNEINAHTEHLVQKHNDIYIFFFFVFYLFIFFLQV